MKHSVLLLAFSALLLPACSGDEVKASEKPAVETLQGAFDQLKGDAAELVRGLGDKLEGLDVDFAELRDRVDEAEGQSRDELQELLDRLEQQRKELAEQFEELGRKSDSATEQTVEKLKRAYEKLERSVSEALDSVK